MGEPAKATPAHVYVSLDAAPTAKERVDLALAEMERVGAFDRSLIMLVSPTGSGYVNYVATAAASYLTLGDLAAVTLQYSKRPSPLSLGKVKGAREQNRLLWLKILQRLHDRPGPRPKVVVFGESLGAHTSQDAFLHWGTHGAGGPRHRPGAVDRHPLRQRLDAGGHRPGPARRRQGRGRGGQRLRPARRPRRGAPGQAALRAGQPRQRRGHQVRRRPAHHRAVLARTRTGRSPRRSPAPARAASRPACGGDRSPPSSRA